MNDSGGLPEGLEQIAPGPALAAAPASVDRLALSERDRVRLVRARNRLVSHVHAELLADLCAVTWDEPGPDGPVPAEAGRYPWAEAEVAWALRWTAMAAGRRMEQARQLMDDFPRVLEALRSGSIDLPKALLIAELASWLQDPAASRSVADQVIDRAPELTTGQLRALLRTLVLVEDPGAARRACAAAVRTRRVESFGNPDGTGELWGRGLAPQDSAAVWERLTAIARAAKSAGDPRTIDQLRADAFLDLLGGEGVAVGGPVTRHTAGLPEADGPPYGGATSTGDARSGLSGGEASSGTRSSPGAVGRPGTIAGRPVRAGVESMPGKRIASPGPRRGVVELQVPLTTLLRLADHPGELAGFGPVIADIARQVAEEQRQATWRFSVYDKVGALIHHGITTRRPEPVPTHAATASKPPPAGEPAGPAGARTPGRTARPSSKPPPAVREVAGRRPSAQLTEFVRARDRTCVAPGCRRPGSSCDIDHTVDWAKGGPTEAANLGLLCRRHHRFKHAPGADLIQFTPGTFGWTTPRGMQYVTRPEFPFLHDDEGGEATGHPPAPFTRTTP